MFCSAGVVMVAGPAEFTAPGLCFGLCRHSVNSVLGFGGRGGCLARKGDVEAR